MSGVGEKIILDVATANDYPPIHEENHYPKSRDQTVIYECSRRDGLITIVPSLGYVEALRKATPVPAIGYMWSPFRWLLPSLDLKVVNNSNETIYITEVILTVERSTPVMEPIPVVKNRCHFQWLQIINEGWQDARDCRLSFNIRGSEHKTFDEPPYEHSLELGTLADELMVDLSDVFRHHGVDVEAIGNSGRKKEAFGPFTKKWAIVTGVLTYNFDDADGHRRESSLHFAAAVFLGTPPAMMYGPPTHKYSIHLDVERSNYEERLPLSQVLKDGETDRFFLRISTDRSSVHTFRLTLRYNGEQRLVTPPMKLEVFIPRSAKSQMTHATTGQED